MSIETTNPNIPENAPKIKYNVPITLWFVENNQRETHEFVKIIIGLIKYATSLYK